MWISCRSRINGLHALQRVAFENGNTTIVRRSFQRLLFEHVVEDPQCRDVVRLNDLSKLHTVLAAIAHRVVAAYPCGDC